MEFCTQEYWSGLPFFSPGDLPDPRIEAAFVLSPVLTSSLPGAAWEALHGAQSQLSCFLSLILVNAPSARMPSQISH